MWWIIIIRNRIKKKTKKTQILSNSYIYVHFTTSAKKTSHYNYTTIRRRCWCIIREQSKTIDLAKIIPRGRRDGSISFLAYYHKRKRKQFLLRFELKLPIPVPMIKAFMPSKDEYKNNISIWFLCMLPKK